MQKKLLLHNLNLFIRSMFFSIFASVTTILYSTACVLAWPLPLPYRYAIARAWMRLNVNALKVICRVNYRLEGAENIPKDRNGIILSKHQSAWETFFLPTIFFEPAIILKKELLWFPFFGWALAAINSIAIDRSAKTTALEQMVKQGKERLEAGRWVLVFPEGTRIPFGQIGKYRLGGAKLAVSTGYPVIPVAHNAGRFWPKRKFIKQPGTIRVVIGPLIETKGRTPEEVMSQAKNWIEKTVLEIDRKEQV